MKTGLNLIFSFNALEIKPRGISSAPVLILTFFRLSFLISFSKYIASLIFKPNSAQSSLEKINVSKKPYCAHFKYSWLILKFLCLVFR